ncbi:ABC transporter permease [Robbsia sp. KACC 23696]|uniref:ABC transporter permease n=1 Tax=Robbsia sp. KACC 23696 TaxID=3149231 RepID=UPI00325BCB2F
MLTQSNKAHGSHARAVAGPEGALQASLSPGAEAAARSAARWRRARRFALRLLRRVATMLAVSVVVFTVLRLLPADPVAMLLPPNASQADVLAMHHTLGLDRPIAVQYLQWLGEIVRGQFGHSLQTGQSVGTLILNALPTTLQLLAGGLVLGVLAGVGAGIFAFLRRDTKTEQVAEVANGLAMSIPDFLWGILLMLAFGIGLRWLPFVGPLDGRYTVAHHTGFLLLDALIDGQFAAFGNALWHLVLPCVALALGIAPPLMRLLRSSLLEVYADDYVTAARLRGLSDRDILWRHGLRNAALPTLNVFGIQVSLMIGGTLLVEKVFGMPGIGNVMISAIGAHDLPTIQALALLYALVVQIVNALVDALELMWNPRLRSAS